jgi:hypothetical protein
MKREKPVHSEPYVVEGAEFRIDVFRCRLGRKRNQFGYHGSWIRLRDGLSGASTGICDSVEEAVLRNRMNAFPHRFED